MHVKATLICEDVRLEVAGTLTLVGVYNEKLVAPQSDGPLHLPRIVFVVVVAGLRGVDRVSYREHIQGVGEQAPPPAEWKLETHHVDADEHNFVFGPAALTVPSAGEYELVFDLQARGETIEHRYRFTLAYDKLLTAPAEQLRAEIRQDLEAANAYAEKHGSFAEMVREHYRSEDDE
jgi:hypothetical protein